MELIDGTQKAAGAALEALGCETFHNCFDCGSYRKNQFVDFRFKRMDEIGVVCVVANCNECGSEQTLKQVTIKTKRRSENVR